MYLEKYEQYLGTGERNAAGLDLKTFLEEYNPKLYDTPANTVDNLIFTYVEENGKKENRKNPSYKKRKSSIYRLVGPSGRIRGFSREP